MSPPNPIDIAITQLEAQRALLGDAAVDAAIQALRRNVAPLHGGARPAGSEAPHGAAAAAEAVEVVEADSAVAAVATGPAGAAVARDATAAPRLRLVSVLFVDVADSTAMLQRVDTEDALMLVSGAVETFARIVQSHGGQVLRFTGDGLKAVFGSLVSREDDAARAVRAGLRVIEASAEHAQRVARPLGVPQFGVRVGIHSGMVLLGSGMDADRSALGHAVHLAARMEQSAPVGRLRISHETWQQVRGLFQVQAQAPLVVKGHDEPLRTYLVLGDEDEAERTIRRGVEGVHAPMVGREAELQRLAEHFRRAVAARAPAAAAVLAEAGLGKTRLRRELMRRLDVTEGAPGPRLPGLLAGTVRVLRVRAQPSSGLQPYGLLRQLLGRWLGIAENLAPQPARTRLVEGVAPWLSESGVARAQRLGQLIGLSFDDESAVQALGARELRDEAFAALREALLAMAARAPLLLVLEDLHWSDAGSLAFVERLLAPAGVPLLLLLLARPPFEPAWLAAGARREPGAPEPLTLTLDTLGGDHAAALADALLAPVADVPPALRSLLVERAAGNPFFAEELVRMLIDEGVIDTGARPWRVHAERLPRLRVPTTLVGVLQARLDTLPPAEATALQQASIIGPVFWSAALGALDAGAVAALPSLVQRGLVVRRPGGSFSQTEEWAFQHQLLHEVTYATVLKAPRRAGHARAARWLAAMVAGREGEFLAVAAEHYERAGESDSALEYYHRALRNAGVRFAHESSLALVERALAQAALTSPWRRFQLMQARAHALERLERRAEWGAAHRALTEWAERNDDDAMRADVLSAEMLRSDHEGRSEEARRLAERVIALVGAGDDPRAVGSLTLAHGELAWLAVAARDFDAADRALRAGLEQARRAALLPAEDGGYDGYELQLRAIEIQALLARERYAEAGRAVRETIEGLAALRKPRPHDRFIYLSHLHVVQRETGQRAAGLETARQALQLALEMSMPRLQATAEIAVADSALDLGDVVAAQEAVDQALSLLERHNNDYSRPVVLDGRGCVAEACGEWEVAERAWQDALERFQAQGRLQGAQTTRAALAEAALRQGRVAEALRLVDEVLKPMPPGRAAGAPVSGANPGEGELRALRPVALLRCLRVLEHAGDARAGAVLEHLRQRLAEQVQQCADAAARQRLLEGVPHWVEVQRRAAGGP